MGFAVWSVALLGASCDKKNPTEPTTGHAAEASASPTAAAAPASLAGVDLSGLNAEQKEHFAKLADTLESPCGKAHSLRMSVNTDPDCKRAVFAARQVARRLIDELSEEEVTALYTARYGHAKTFSFDLSASPFLGVPTAPLVLVEFFDYGCPHCKLFSPILEDVLAEFPSDTVLYYKNFPLSAHLESVPAAIAAVCAQRQGKFREMHKKLFANQDEHSKEDLFHYAKDIGLDMKKFEADFNDMKVRAKVMSDREEGAKSEVVGTPSLFINGRQFTDPMTFDDIVSWVREELAVR